MGRKAAKELLHIKGWLERVDEIVQRVKDAYHADDLFQEAGWLDPAAPRGLITSGRAAHPIPAHGPAAADSAEEVCRR
jgi:hypothetical protein